MNKPTKKQIRDAFNDLIDEHGFIQQPINVVEIRIKKLFESLKGKK